MDDDEPRPPRLCVLAATSILTVTVEPRAETEEDERGAGSSNDRPADVHVHAGGQGLWIARMARALAAEVTVCGPFGGETGGIIEHLTAQEQLRVRGTHYAGSNGAYVHDRRAGERTEVARMAPTPLGRHELDDLFGTVLVEALDADVCVVAGAYPATTIPPSFFARLTGDLRPAGNTIVADLSGRAGLAVLDAGVDVLKMSHEEMCEAGLSDGEDRADLIAGAQRVLESEVRAMVVSRAAEPGLLVTAEGALEVVVPAVETVDHRGAGDSMTAGIAVGLGRGMSLPDAVRLGAAAGALNVTRRGLGTGRRDHIERFAQEVVVRPVQ